MGAWNLLGILQLLMRRRGYRLPLFQTPATKPQKRNGSLTPDRWLTNGIKTQIEPYYRPPRFVSAHRRDIGYSAQDKTECLRVGGVRVCFLPLNNFRIGTYFVNS